MVSSLFKGKNNQGSGHATSSESEADVDFNEPVQTSYKSNPVAIPADFLSVQNPPADAKPITIKQIDFTKTPLPQYAGLYAVVLDHVLSPSECETLLRLAEASVPDADRLPKKNKGKHVKEGGQGASVGTDTEAAPVSDPWRPALVNVGGGWEALYKDYRNSDRIIWDQQEVVDRLWERCAQAPGLREQLAKVKGSSPVLATASQRNKDQKWEFRRFNQRMRFLKYQKGQFFRAHCDGPYAEPDPKKQLETLFTVHLYLNDCKAEAEPGEAGMTELIGGATTFLSGNEKKRLDVNPKAGRVLIFQHKRLFHSGDDVLAGTKYTMRTDIIYEMVGFEDEV